MAFGNGTLAGLVAITSPCSTVYPWAAIIIGGVSGVLYCIGSEVRGSPPGFEICQSLLVYRFRHGVTTPARPLMCPRTQTT